MNSSNGMMNVFYGFYLRSRKHSNHLHVFDPKLVKNNGFVVVYSRPEQYIEGIDKLDFQVSSECAMISHIVSKKYIFGQIPRDQFHSLIAAAKLFENPRAPQVNAEKIIEFRRQTLPRMISELEEELRESRIK